MLGNWIARIVPLYWLTTAIVIWPICTCFRPSLSSSRIYFFRCDICRATFSRSQDEASYLSASFFPK